ncbi:MAG: YigZ family protein [Bacteroidetes bacterium]|nr:YigZ family protein [Bacteroidota bacterium]
MNKSFQFYTINQSASAEYKERNSKFIAYAYPFQNKNELKNHIDGLKKIHTKATHFCFAYRIGNDGSQFRSSDNGEPSGTAGKPILGQIDKYQLSDILIIVVRYFGGTLLGTAGLTNAYKTSAALVLQMLPVITKNIEIHYHLHFPYERINEIMQVLKESNARILQQELMLFCKLDIFIPLNNVQPFLSKTQFIQGLELLEMKEAEEKR